MKEPRPPSPPGKVLMTADTIGGVWTYAIELARGLCASGSKVILATKGQALDAAQAEESANIAGLTVVESSYRLEWMPDSWSDVDAAGGWLLELADEFKPDIVHLNDFSHGNLPWTSPVLVVGHSCV